MTTYPAATLQHHTVPIGGPAFVHPTFGSRANDGYASSSSSSASSSPSQSPTSSKASYAWDLRRPSGSGDAALAYSRMLHQHTSTMWQNERQNIERARVESRQSSAGLATRSPRASLSGSSTGSNSTSGPAAEASSTTAPSRSAPAAAMDFLLGRSRSKKEKNPRAGAIENVPAGRAK